MFSASFSRYVWTEIKGEGLSLVYGEQITGLKDYNTSYNYVTKRAEKHSN